MSSKSGAAGEILFFESEKSHEIRPLKTDTLTESAFDAFIHVHDFVPKGAQMGGPIFDCQ